MKNEKLATLVIEAQKGNQKALSDLIESCYNDIYYFALKTVKKEDVAADITQDACLKIIQSLGKLNEPMAFKSWALRITYNLCSTHFSTPQDVLVEENEDGETVFDTLVDYSEDAQPDKAYENAEFKQIMRDMIESLPAEQASALMLYYYEKASVKEISEIHGVSEGTVKSRLNYGRKAVKEKVEDYEKRTGIRLHSITPLPLLLAWFFAQSAEKAPATVAAAISSSVAGAAGVGAAATASAAAGATAATAAGATTATAAGAAAATTAAVAVAAKAGVSALAAKVIAIVVGAALAVSAAVGGIYIATNNSDTEITEEDNGNGGENGGNDSDISTDEEASSNGLEFHPIDGGASYGVSGIGTCTDTEIVIPSTHKGKPVIFIYERVFKNCTSLTSITIPDSIIGFGRNVFEGCTSLTSITIPFVGEWKDGTESTRFGYIFGGTAPASLKTVTITGGSSIADKAFRDCGSITSITLPNSIKTIGEWAFADCTSLTNINIPDSVTSIGEWAFEGCTSLTSITIGNGVTSIGEDAFCGCTSLVTITIPNSVTTINERAFCNCTSLTNVTLPDSIAILDGEVFKNCTSLTSITIPDSVTGIAGDTFVGCTSLKSITIPNSVTSIGGKTFQDCTSLTSITIPNSITSIDDRTFAWCTSLTSVTIPDSITSIDSSAFSGCSSLKTITFSGTMAQWNAISKGSSWDSYTPDYTVHCTDGDIAK